MSETFNSDCEETWELRIRPRSLTAPARPPSRHLRSTSSTSSSGEDNPETPQSRARRSSAREQLPSAAPSPSNPLLPQRSTSRSGNRARDRLESSAQPKTLSVSPYSHQKKSAPETSEAKPSSPGWPAIPAQPPMNQSDEKVPISPRGNAPAQEHREISRAYQDLPPPGEAPPPRDDLLREGRAYDFHAAGEYMSPDDALRARALRIDAYRQIVRASHGHERALQTFHGIPAPLRGGDSLPLYLRTMWWWIAATKPNLDVDRTVSRRTFGNVVLLRQLGFRFARLYVDGAVESDIEIRRHLRENSVARRRYGESPDFHALGLGNHPAASLVFDAPANPAGPGFHAPSYGRDPDSPSRSRSVVPTNWVRPENRATAQAAHGHRSVSGRPRSPSPGGALRHRDRGSGAEPSQDAPHGDHADIFSRFESTLALVSHRLDRMESDFHHRLDSVERRVDSLEAQISETQHYVRQNYERSRANEQSGEALQHSLASVRYRLSHVERDQQHPQLSSTSSRLRRSPSRSRLRSRSPSPSHSESRRSRARSRSRSRSHPSHRSYHPSDSQGDRP